MKATEVLEILDEAKKKEEKKREENEKVTILKAKHRLLVWTDETGSEKIEVMLTLLSNCIQLHFSTENKMLMSAALVYKVKEEDAGLDLESRESLAVKFGELKKLARQGGLKALGIKSLKSFGKDWEKA